MDETIDLRPYVEALVRRWWVILGAVIASVVLAVFLYFSQSHYRATALVAVIDPAQRLQFDTRIVNSVDLDTLLQAYPELAMSDSVMSSLMEWINNNTESQVSNLSTLRDMLDVETSSDGRLVRLMARHTDPEMASELANVWATIFVANVDAIYLTPGGEVEFFTNQLAQTETNLLAVEQALVDFQSGSRLSIVENELKALNDQQATYLAEKNRLRVALDDIQSLREQIAAGSGETIPWADQLTALMIQMKIYSTEPLSIVGLTPLQLQLNSQGELTSNQRTVQLDLLNELNRTAQTRLGEIDVQLLGLEFDIFDLQRERQDLTNQYEQLIRDRDIAKETYSTVARKIDEVRIQSEDRSTSLRVASLASPPVELDRSNPVTLIMMAGSVGLLLSIALLIALTWWKGGPGSRA